jgi:hypothetical protein
VSTLAEREAVLERLVLYEDSTTIIGGLPVVFASRTVQGAFSDSLAREIWLRSGIAGLKAFIVGYMVANGVEESRAQRRVDSVLPNATLEADPDTSPGGHK